MIRIFPQTWQELLIALPQWVLLGLLAPRLFYWISGRRKTLPNVRSLRHLYCYKELWADKAPRLWVRQPGEAVNFVGLFTTILWIGVALINLLLLAQILELVAVGGSRISMGVFGKYNVLGLMTAAIWILAQIFLGHISYVARSGIQRGSVRITELLPGWGWYTILVLSVVVEFILGIVRAWLLSIGEMPESPTMIDAVIMRGGPFIAGFVSFIVPVVEVGSGVIAIDSYVGINWNVWTRRSKALWLWFWAAFLRIFFCFFPKLPSIVYSSVRDLRSKAEQWKNRGTNLQRQVQNFPALNASLPSEDIDAICNLAEHRATIRNIGKRVGIYRHCPRDIQDLWDVLEKKNSVNFWNYHNSIQSAINNDYPGRKKKVETDYGSITAQLKSAERRLKGLSGLEVRYDRTIRDWRRRLAQWENSCLNISNSLDLLEKQKNDLAQRVEMQIQSWQDARDDVNDTLSSIQQGLNNALDVLNAAIQRLKDAQGELDAAQNGFDNARQEVKAARKKLSQVTRKHDDAQKKFNKAQGNLDSAKNSDASPQELEEAEQELMGAEQELQNSTQELSEAQRELTDSEQALNDAQQESDMVQQRLSAAQEYLNEAHQQYYDTRVELVPGRYDAEAELAEAEGNLAELDAAQTALASVDTSIISTELKRCEEETQRRKDDLENNIAPLPADEIARLSATVDNLRAQVNDIRSRAMTDLASIKNELDREWSEIQRIRRSRPRLIRWLFLRRDELRLTISPATQNSSWLYIFRLDMANYLELLFGEQVNASSLDIPNGDGCFLLDRYVGEESVFVVISNNHRKDWEDLFTSNGKRGDENEYMKRRSELRDELQRIMREPTSDLYGYVLNFKYQPESK